jgi:hypothetical protein
MTTGLKTSKRGEQPARLFLVIVSSAILLAGPIVFAGDPLRPSAPIGSVHFYSTASPPDDYPGPTPEPTNPGNESVAANEPVEPPASEPAPASDPVADEQQSGDVGIRGNEQPAADRRATDPDADPMRLASTGPRDRVPDGGRSAPAAEEVAAPVEADPIASAKAAVAACKARFETVRDYTCTFIKRERINGRLSAYEVMTMKARTSPSSVYFKFRQPNAGREAIYVHGRNNGKAIVHDVGLGRLVAGTLHLDPGSRRAMDGNRHPITEAGIGFMIDTVLEGWHREMNPLDTVVTIRERVLVNKRPSTMIICSHPQRAPHFVFHEVRLYIDSELGLPLRFEAYDWPRREGEAPPLVEEYTYTDVQLNVGLSDHDFDPSNKTYSFGRF